MFVGLAFGLLWLQSLACIKDGSEGTSPWPGCVLLKTQVVINVLLCEMLLHLHLTSDGLGYRLCLPSLVRGKWYSVISKWGIHRGCVCFWGSLTACGIWWVPVHKSHPCLHSPSTKDPLFCLLFWGMSFGELNSDKVISHQSLSKRFEASQWNHRPPRCPILRRVCPLWRGETEREIVH